MNLATGIGGHRTSKRGSVSINFKVYDSNFRIINMHLSVDTLPNRLRDLSKILAEHRMAIEDKGCNIFLVGAFNFNRLEDFRGDPEKSRQACEFKSIRQKMA